MESVKILSWEGGEKTQGASIEEQFGDISKGAAVRLKVCGADWTNDGSKTR